LSDVPSRLGVGLLSCALACLVTAAPALAQTAPAGAPPQPPPSKFRSPEDGWFDLGGFLDTKFGFMPVATVITEPAVGYGMAGGLAFINKPLIGDKRPDITMVGGLGTGNGTKGALAGDLHHWFDGRLQTLGGVIWASVNLDYYGLGDDSVLADNPLRYNLEPAGGIAQARYRLAASPYFAGVRYTYSRTLVAFEAPAGTPGLPGTPHRSDVGGLAPSRGSYVEGSVSFFSDAFGGDDEFQVAQVLAMYYAPLPGQVFLGVRGEAATSSDETPFYMRPFVYQRGVPVMRYLGKEMTQVEGEARWQFWKRLSAVGFGGVGVVWPELTGLAKTVGSGGGGVR
jgi:hypothetical protein